MGIKIQELAFVLRASDYLSPVLKNVSREIEHVNAAAKSTAHIREAAGNLAMTGAALAGAGAGIAVPIYSALKTAMEAQGHYAHLATAYAGDGVKAAGEVAEAQRIVEAIAQKSIVSTGNLTDALYLAVSAGLSAADANKALAAANNLVVGTTKDAAEANAAMADTFRTLTILQMNYTKAGQDGAAVSKHYADMLAYLQTRKAFKDITEVRGALSYAAPAAALSGVAPEQMVAAMAILSQRGKLGPEGGVAVAEIINKFATKHLIPYAVKTKKGDLDLVASVGKLLQQFGNLGKEQLNEVLQQQLKLGQRVGPTLGALILGYKDFAQVTQEAGSKDVLNAALQAATTRMAAADEQLARFTNNLEVLKETLGTSLLPAAARIAGHLTSIAQAANRFADAHPGLVKLAMSFGAVTSAVLLLGGALSLTASGLLGFASFYKTISAIAGVIRVATGAQLAFNTVAAINPYVLAIMGITALVMLTIRMYRHWEAFRNLVNAVGHDLAHPLESMKHLGKWAITPIAPRAHPIIAMPTHVGAAGLARAVVADVGHVAAAGGAHAWAAIAGESVGRRAAPVVISLRSSNRPPPVINQHITVNASGTDPTAIKAAVLDAARSNTHELKKILDDEDAKRDRTKYE